MAALVIALAFAHGMAAAQEAPVRLDFETWADGSPACERCPVSDEYRSRGVVFEFFSRFTGPADPYLIGSGAYDPEGEETNHAVTAALTDEGFRPGLLVLRFPDGPRRVAFVLRGSDAVAGFVVRAFGPDGSPLPDGSVSRATGGRYQAGKGGRFREERISVEGGSGVGRVELDGRGPPGHILLVDDLTLWSGEETSRPEGPGEETPGREGPGEETSRPRAP